MVWENNFYQGNDMSISGMDYSRMLADKKQQFRSDLEGTRESYKKGLKTLKDSHEMTEKKAKDNYDGAKVSMEKRFNDRQADVTGESREILLKSRDSHNASLKKRTEEFASKTEEQISNYNNRLNDIRGGYKDRLTNEEKQNRTVQDNLQSRHTARTGELQHIHERQIGDLLESSIGANLDLREKMVGKQKSQQRSHAKESDQMRKKHTISKNEQSYRNKQQLDKMRDVQRYEMGRIQADKKGTIASMKKGQNDNLKSLHVQYDDANRRSQDIQGRENAKASRKLSELLSGQEKRHAEERFKKRMRDRQTVGAGTRIGEMRKDSVLKEAQDRFDFKAKRMDKNLNETVMGFNDAGKKSKDIYDGDLVKTKIDNLDRLTEQEVEHNIYMTDKLAAERGEKNDAVNAYRNRYSELQKSSNEAMNREIEKGSTHLKNELENHNNLVQNLTKSNHRGFSEFRDSEKKLRTEYISDVQRQQNDNYHEMRDDFREKITSSEELRTKSVDGLKMQNADLKDSLAEAKFTERERADGRIKDQKQLFTEQRKEDYRALKELMKKREYSLRQQLHDQRLKSDAKQQVIVQDSQRKLKKVTSHYEQKLNSMIREFNTKLRRKENSGSRELDRLKFDWQESQKRLVGQYENQMQTMRLNYEAKLEKVAQRDPETHI